MSYETPASKTGKRVVAAIIEARSSPKVRSEERQRQYDAELRMIATPVNARARRERTVSDLRKHLDLIESDPYTPFTRKDFHAAMDLLRASEAREKELLEALRELREWHKNEYQSNQWIDARVDAAIAKELTA